MVRLASLSLLPHFSLFLLHFTLTSPCSCFTLGKPLRWESLNSSDSHPLSSSDAVLRLHQLGLFDFQSLLIVLMLSICTCTYVKMKAPTLLLQKTGWVRVKRDEGSRTSSVSRSGVFTFSFSLAVAVRQVPWCILEGGADR